MEDNRSYDLVILGGGAAAFAAITEASGRGLSTAIVNTGLPIGGTCVNVGCVPSKHLLAVGESAAAPQKNPFEAVQYSDDEPTVDWDEALDGTDALVERFRQENYVDVAEHFETDIYEGYGELVDDTTIEIVDGPDKGIRITGEKTLVATGSSPWVLPIDGLDGVDYYTSETILKERNLPGSIVIIGGGYIALEWGQILHRIGVDVTILQRSERVLSGMEGQLGREMQRAFEEEGIKVITGNDFQRVRAPAVDGGADAIQSDVGIETLVDGNERTVTGDALFVATGVQPNSEDIGLETVGVEANDDGAILVDEHFQTANPDVYAAGDVIGEPELETVAAKEGNHAIKNAFGNEGVTIDYDTVPAVVFTSPEVASVGTTELEYMDEHGTCSCRTVQMEDVPRAKAVKNTDGLVQVVKHHETDEIVGVHMVGPRAADMIMEATLAVKFGLTVDDIIDTVHPFPTFSEAFKHACQAFRRDTSTMSCCVE
ncbi:MULTISPECIES: mercury(II) reductase [Haloferacaceae]|jgi:mercuric reductase|uniref:Mercuric reductase n=1 Tax=Halorubrum lacusprofundi (strain ATCC 49239 / DSM 5036 / JCM 8891 / ACAM 34) TaxID=416348 RepID=B9LV27_HALLT|nr:mercury(II) reductase [Halorubrum lacusprofundi]ACM58540.1 mercuric reductase [Halorubrum lacusprofundi ATCC 49239]AEN04819.1 mercuric reductase [halophilic archaeon DL31]MCG1008202.1 mercury(II) reductase [Halorubrum lacusprofundi]